MKKIFAVWIIAIAIGIGALFAVKGINRYKVSGNSMYPTLKDGASVLIEKFNKDPKILRRGKVVLYITPATARAPQIIGDENWLRLGRIIGLPTEHVEIINEAIFIDGEKLNEPYMSVVNATRVFSLHSWQLSSGEYFILGDNRDHSVDSRVFGPILVNNIEGSLFSLKNL